MKVFWIGLNLFVLAMLVVRFVQPLVIYWLRELVIAVGMNKAILESGSAERQGAKWDRERSRKFIQLMVMDLRPEGASGRRQKILPRVLDVRKLYSLLDPRRQQMKDLPQVESSRKCVIELANMLASLARELEPNASFDYSSIKADELLHMIVHRRAQKNREADGLPQQDDEELQAFLQEKPLTIEQLNELVIAAIYAPAFRLEGDERRKQEEAVRQLALRSPRPAAGAALAMPHVGNS